MFFVFNKRKINSYLISIGTVIILFAVSMFATKGMNNTIETSASNASNQPIYKVETERKKVALSINCSESVENIDSIVDLLSKMKAKATFYVTGELASKYPEQIKKITNNGYEVGNLSYHYTNLKNKNTEEIQEEISKCTQQIEKTTNVKVKTFRAPYGECDSIIIREAAKQNLSTVQWNIDSLDYNGLNSEEICERINEGLTPGSIILLHNTGEYTVSSIEDIIHNIQKQEYEICTVSDLIALQN